MRFIDNFKLDNFINLFIQNVKVCDEFESRFKNDENNKNNKNNKINISDKATGDFKLNNRYNCINIIKLIFFFNEFKFEFFFSRL